MSSGAPSPDRNAGNTSDGAPSPSRDTANIDPTNAKLPVLPKGHVPLQASFKLPSPDKTIRSSFHEGVAKWFKKKETSIDRVNLQLHESHERTMLRKRKSSSALLLAENEQLPNISVSADQLPIANVVCERCHGFLKHEFVASLPVPWSEVLLPSGRIGFQNVATKALQESPPQHPQAFWCSNTMAPQLLCAAAVKGMAH
ncbi:hypothetical protein ACHHYP_13546 [Achlya hypogyna]|uniref:Uncharacterized protein n=1 Tax=Achlya hypogyna TaxID=1202772 RepID=A0A1V9YF20_ACHHY|nr:hypothetical protein ACHHYP_13546 [Achlya hypogyna]